MSEFIFELQRFDGEGSSSGASGGTGGGSTSGGSNAKTDGDTTTETAETWKDDWGNYSAKERSGFAAQAYATAQTDGFTEYVATEFADNISVSGLVNNVIYGVNRFDTVNFVDLNLESFALFANYLEGVYYDDLDTNIGGGYVDLIFRTGTVTRLYLADTEFTPTLNFSSGLSEVYSFDLKHWFGTDETSTSTGYWNRSDILNNYVGYIGTAGVPEQITASQTVNNFIVADNEDAIYIYDASLSDITEMKEGTDGSVPTITSTGTVENVSDKAINFKFKNGTSTLIYYDGTFSPNIYFGSGEVFAYNSKMGALRTPEEIQSDAADYAAEDAQAVLDKAAFDANFNVVYDTAEDSYDEETAFVGSRFANTMIYNTYSTNDVYFNDAVQANVVDVIQEDDFNFDIVFDTGAVTRVNYLQVVSPIFHFADGTALAYDYAKKEFIPSYSGLKGGSTGSIGGDGESGGEVSADLADDGLAVSYYLVPTEENGEDTKENETIRDTTVRDHDFTRTNNPRYEVYHEDFVVSRTNDGFINKVTAGDDIWLVDTALENITDLSVTYNGDIIFTFDTGKQLRVRDESTVSPVFHLADGTTTAYNWSANQWAGGQWTNVTEAPYNHIADDLFASSLTNNFIRNAEQEDYIYFDTTPAHVADVYRNLYYIVYTFDTGESTAVRYTDARTPTFVFADGSTSQWLYYDTDNPYNVDDTQYFNGDYAAAVSESWNLSKNNNNVVYDAGDEDTVNFIDAIASDVTAITNPNGYTIEVTFNTGKTATIEWWDNYSPLLKFADGTTLVYDYSTSQWSANETHYTGNYSVVDTFSLNKDNNNTVSNVRQNDLITFTNAASTDVVNISATRDDETYNDTITFTFNTGATTSIEYTSSYSPTIQFADGAAYQYYYSSYSDSLTAYNASVGTDAPDTFILSSATDNRVTNAGAADTVLIGDASYGDVTYEYISPSSYSPYLEFAFGDYDNRTYTYVYYNADEGLTPNIVFADGTSYQYNVYQTISDTVDNVAISSLNNSLVYYADAEDYISVVDADINDVTLGTSGYYRANLTFNNTGKNAIVGMNDAVSPLFMFADGSILAYAGTTRTWGIPVFATDAADNIPLSSTVSNIVCNAASNDTISIVDAAQANVTDIDTVDYGAIGLTFDNGTSTTVTYTGNTTPVIALTDGTIQYNAYNPTYEADTFNISRTIDNIVYGFAYPEDTVNFTDATISNVAGVSFENVGWNVVFTFDTGNSTSVEYSKSLYGITPTFTFADGSSYRYVNTSSNQTTADVWQKYDAASGTWQTASESVLTVESADLAESADLWGDNVDDDLFVDGTIAVDATLSDLVAAPVDNAAVSFNAESAFDINAAGGFIVASTATDSSQKTA